MHVLAVEVDLRLPDAHSLKDKRQVVRSILDTNRRRYGVAAAEVAHQDHWQRAVLGFAAVGSTAAHVEEVIGAVEDAIWAHPAVEVLSMVRSWLEP